jgi:hypothetical protein
MLKVGIGCLLVLLVVAGLAVFWVMGAYNGLVAADEAVSTAWAQVETAYQRRADLIPNLVATVKGSAEFEQETLTQVIEARAQATRVGIEATPDLLSNPETFSRFQQAQDALSSALARLLVVVERYPELKTVAAFQDLMVQLEGTERREPSTPASGEFRRPGSSAYSGGPSRPRATLPPSRGRRRRHGSTSSAPSP